ncbi:hypothetical protein BMETH_297911992016, partial [methanotrophic bacterial endosymbiont of Bathymodiolus sp.]
QIHFPLAIAYLDVMLDMTNYSTTSFQFAQVLTYEAFYAFLISLILSTPTYPRLTMYLDGLVQENV